MPRKIILVFGRDYEKPHRELSEYCQKKLPKESFDILGDGRGLVKDIDFASAKGTTKEAIFMFFVHGTWKAIKYTNDGKDEEREQHMFDNFRETTGESLKGIKKNFAHEMNVVMYSCRLRLDEDEIPVGMNFLAFSSGKHQTLIAQGVLNGKNIIDLVAEDIRNELSVRDIFAGAVATYPESARYYFWNYQKIATGDTANLEILRFRRPGIFEIDEVAEILKVTHEKKKESKGEQFDFSDMVMEVLKAAAPKKTNFSVAAIERIINSVDVPEIFVEHFEAERRKLSDALEARLIEKLSEENIRAYLIKRAEKLGKVVKPLFSEEYPCQYQLFGMAFYIRDDGDLLHALEENGVHKDSQTVLPGRVTPLMREVRDGDIEAIDTLIEKGINPSLRDDNGENIIYYIIRNGDLTIIDKVRAKIPASTANQSITALFKCVNKDGVTPIDLAIKLGCFEGVKSILLKSGADIYKVGADPDLFRYVQNFQSWAIGMRMSRFGGNANQTNENGETPLMLACRIGNVDAVKVFLKFHSEFEFQNILIHPSPPMKSEFVKINFSQKNNYGETAIDIAIKNGHFDIVAEFSKVVQIRVSDLLKLKPEKEKKERKSADSSSAKPVSHKELFEGINFVNELYLTKKKIGLEELKKIDNFVKKFPLLANLTDDKGRCLLSYCMMHLDSSAHKKFEETAKLLINEGNINFKDYKKRNPLKIACDKNLKSLAEIIASKMKEYKPEMYEFDPFYYQAKSDIAKSLAKIAGAKINPVKKEEDKKDISDKDFISPPTATVIRSKTDTIVVHKPASTARPKEKGAKRKVVGELEKGKGK